MVLGALAGGILGGAIQGGLGLWGNHMNNEFNSDEANKSRDFNSAEAKKSRDWQEYMSGSSIQRGVADANKAGVNPLFASGMSGSSPSGATASGGSASGNAPDFKGVGELMTLQSQLAKANIGKTEADTLLSTSLAEKSQADKSVSLQTAKNLGADFHKKDVTGNVYEGVGKFTSDIPKLADFSKKKVFGSISNLGNEFQDSFKSRKKPPPSNKFKNMFNWG